MTDIALDKLKALQRSFEFLTLFQRSGNTTALMTIAMQRALEDLPTIVVFATKAQGDQAISSWCDQNKNEAHKIRKHVHTTSILASVGIARGRGSNTVVVVDNSTLEYLQSGLTETLNILESNRAAAKEVTEALRLFEESWKKSLATSMARHYYECRSRNLKASKKVSKLSLRSSSPRSAFHHDARVGQVKANPSRPSRIRTRKR